MRTSARILIVLSSFIVVSTTTIFSEEPETKNEVVSEPAIDSNGHINIGATSTQGNTDSKNLYLDGELVARRSKNRYTIVALVNYAKDGDQTIADNWTASMKYDRFLNEKWYLYNNALFTKDEFKDLNLRISLGPGVGHQFWQSELMNLSVESGLSYIDDDLISDGDDSYTAGRLSTNFDRYLVPERVKFFHFHEILTELGGNENMLVRTQTGFRFPLYKNFIASAQFNYDWEKEPAPGTEKGDALYIFTLGYEW